MSDSKHSEKNNSARWIIKSESTKNINRQLKTRTLGAKFNSIYCKFPEKSNKGNEWNAVYSTSQSRSSLTSSKNRLVKSSEAEDLSFETGGSKWYGLTSMVKVKKNSKSRAKVTKNGNKSKTNWSQNSAKGDRFVWQADQHLGWRKKQEREPWERGWVSSNSYIRPKITRVKVQVGLSAALLIAHI